MKIELTKSLRYKDSELDVLELNLEELTGNDLLDVESNLRAQGMSVTVWEASRGFLIAVAAKAMHIPSEVLKGLNVRDFSRVVNETARFLYGTDSEDSRVTSSGE